jgi:putative nucleotidyltransferase with HDIG domain
MNPAASPPRLVVRTLATTFVTTALVLAAVFAAVLYDVRDRVRRAVAERLDVGQRVFSSFELQRQRDMAAQVAVLADSPTLKAALDTYVSERGGGRPTQVEQLRRTIQGEIDKLAERFPSDLLAAVDASRRTVAVGGPRRTAWPTDYRLPPARSIDEGTLAAGGTLVLPSGVFRALTTPLTLGGAKIGELYLAFSLDNRYAGQLSGLSGADTVILFERRVVGTTLGVERAAAITHAAESGLPVEGIVELGGEAHAIRRLFQTGAAQFYALSSMDAAADAAMSDALTTIARIAAGAIALAGLASLLLARNLSQPIDRLSQSILEMRASGAIEGALPVTGSSRELDSLTEAFNELMRSVSAAQEETRVAYVGAIRALAAALDARDPYTAGHSERVSTLSAAIGREMAAPDDQIEVLRLGALLHDIGKIGVSDDVLRKPGPLTREEVEIIKRHPTLGARILGPVPFLKPQLPIVELHHERLDGGGYPYGLQGEQIPLLARIVHVADAFDAITTARAYRPARSPADAVAELWRGAGTDFDPSVVAAFVRALSTVAVGQLADTGERRSAHPASAAAVAIFAPRSTVRRAS